MNIYILVTSLFLYVQLSCGLEFSKQQRYNADFLAHESGGNVEGAKINVGASSQLSNTHNLGYIPSNREHDVQFPALKTPSTSRPQQSSGKRDYVAPQRPSQVTQTSHVTAKTTTTQSTTVRPQQSSGKRDYVAPQRPLQDSHYSTMVSKMPTSPGTTAKPQQPSGKRDYVSPQHHSQTSTTQRTPGKVKDLINFFDNPNKKQNAPQNIPSYSSILKGNNPSTSSTPTQKPATTPHGKPSFSAVAAQSTTQTITKPTTQTTTKPTSNRPGGGTVLPSDIINRNQNNRGTNNNNNSPTDVELQTLSEELLRKDTNNAAKYITINYQDKSSYQSKEDKAPNPLLTVAPEAWNIPTIQKFMPLLDNYERDTLVNEYVTPQERNEENAFMDAIMSTQVIRHLMNFLKDKGYVTQDPKQHRDFLKSIWFNLYSRGKGKISSSGFEHTFVSELKNGEVLGFHNWIYFAREEMANRVNYLGYYKYIPLNDKGVVLKMRFEQQGVDKPSNSLFIGTSPELEIALYTLCFVTRADNECLLKLGAKDVKISSYTFRYRSKNYIGSAFPRI